MDQYKHTPEGALVNLDPYSHYCVVGNKVRMINAEKAEIVACTVKQGGIGVITEDNAYANQLNRSLKKSSGRGRQVEVLWNSDCISRDHYEKYDVVFYCDESCVEPVID